MAGEPNDQMFIPEAREDREHVELLLRVARMYYLDQATQNEIARAIGYSRPTVSRLLAEARRRNVVSVTVAHPLEQVLDTERRLVQQFGLKHAVVAASSPGLDPARPSGGWPRVSSSTSGTGARSWRCPTGPP